jgi:hypothetical protein
LVLGPYWNAYVVAEPFGSTVALTTAELVVTIDATPVVDVGVVAAAARLTAAKHSTNTAAATPLANALTLILSQRSTRLVTLVLLSAVLDAPGGCNPRASPLRRSPLDDPTVGMLT